MYVAIALIILTSIYRVLAGYQIGLVNFSPVMALAFCGGVYFKNPRLWFVPFLALSLSDLWLNQHYAAMGYSWGWSGMLIRIACFACSLGLGVLVSQRKNWLTLFSGVFSSSLLFYFVTNSVSWSGDAYYAKTPTGWWQAMTIGHFEYIPTVAFLWHSLISDFLFTGLFVLAMETVAIRSGKSSLFVRAQAKA